MIAGLEDITEGTASIDGVVVNDVAQRPDIAMVFKTTLFTHMTVWDNMAFGLKLRKYSKEDIDKRVQEAAEILDWKNSWNVNQWPFRWSTSTLPWVVQSSVMQKCSWWTNLCQTWCQTCINACWNCENHRRIGATTIYVTHDQTEAMTLADRIVIMSATKNPAGTGTIGRVEQIGTPQSLQKPS